MNALNKWLIMRAKPPSPKPLRTMRDKRTLDDHLLKWSWLYVTLVFVGLYGGEWLYHSTRDGVRLTMTTELKR